LHSLLAMDSLDRSRDLTAAIVFAVVVFLVFAVMVAGVLTDNFQPKDTAVTWVGAGFVGIAAAVFTAWAIVLRLDSRMEWAQRLGGDLLLVGVAVALLFLGLPTFAAGTL
jgi:hypothetical protein